MHRLVMFIVDKDRHELFRTGRHWSSVPPPTMPLLSQGPLSVGKGECPQFLQLKTLKLCSRADRERTHKLPPTLPQRVSLLPCTFYLPETYIPAVALKRLSCSQHQHSELLLLLQHHLFPLLIKTLSECSTSRLPSAARMSSSSCSSNSSSRRRPKLSSRHSSNS
jgi:hypothetical protein